MLYGMVVVTPRIANSTEISKSDVIHCFSDPLSDELYQYYQKCPLESFKHGGRCRNAYIDHYKEMVMYEFGTSNDLHLATDLPAEQNMSKMQHVHKIPRKETVCVDFDEQCYCKWINIHDGMCHRLKARSVLVAGDSMLRKQLEKLKSICPKQQALYTNTRFFNPAHRRDFDDVKKELMDNKNISIFYVGFALHSISEINHNDREYADLWTHYESYISKTIETVNKLRPDVQVVWFIPNTIISTHLYGDFRERFDAVLMNNLAKMHQNNREKWELSVSRSFTRRSVVALAQRSERILQQRFPEVHVISGLRITDFMERYTDAHDGVHFPPFLRLKLSILFTLSEERLLYPP